MAILVPFKYMAWCVFFGYQRESHLVCVTFREAYSQAWNMRARAILSNIEREDPKPLVAYREVTITGVDGLRYDL